MSASEVTPEVMPVNEHAIRLGLLLQEQNTLQRQTRNAARFVAWLAGVLVVLSLIGGVYMLAQFSKAVNTINSPADVTLCQSLGGTDPSC